MAGQLFYIARMPKQHGKEGLMEQEEEISLKFFWSLLQGMGQAVFFPKLFSITRREEKGFDFIKQYRNQFLFDKR